MGKAVETMKIANLIVAAGLLSGTDLLARVLSQGVEQALFTTMMEWTIGRAMAGRRFLLKTAKKL
jgi:hypothetical protein